MGIGLSQPAPSVTGELEIMNNGAGATEPSAGTARVEGGVTPVEEAKIPVADRDYRHSGVTHDAVDVYFGAFSRLDDRIRRFQAWQRVVRHDFRAALQRLLGQASKAGMRRRSTTPPWLPEPSRTEDRAGILLLHRSRRGGRRQSRFTAEKRQFGKQRRQQVATIPSGACNGEAGPFRVSIQKSFESLAETNVRRSVAPYGTQQTQQGLIWSQKATMLLRKAGDATAW